MKYIGIDYGTKKTGIAISDPLGTMAFPRSVLATSKLLPSVVADIIEEEGIGGVVIGESRDLSGGLNAVAADAQRFVDSLQGVTSTDLEIHYEDERFTTKQARALPSEGKARGDVANTRGGKQKTTLADAQAAALILQSFLDKQQNMR